MKISSTILLSSTGFLATCSLLSANDNEFLGTSAGGSSTGMRNVAIGDYAAPNLTTHDGGIFMGYYAGNSFTTKHSVFNSSGQIAIGFRAAGLWTQTEWDDYLADPVANPLPDIDDNGTPGIQTAYGALNNTFIGFQAGMRNYLGSDSVFVGYRAGESNTKGQDNTFIGQEAGRDNTIGTDNTFVGEDAGRNNTLGNDNTAVGSRALTINQIGRFNTVVGQDAGSEIGRHGFTLAHERVVRNTCIGNAAGLDIGVGHSNTMIGDNAGPNTEHANFNTFVGQNAGFDNNRTNLDTNAHRNTALGAFSGYTNREGEDNVWIGVFADSGQWLPSYDQAGLLTDMMYGPAWGPTPSFVPSDANRVVNRTIVLGSFASARNDDSIALGYNARTTQANSITIGNGSSATGLGDITIGTSATSSHAGAITIGNSATSHGDNLAVIGSASTVGWDPGADGVTALGSSSYRFSSVTSETFSAEADASANAVISMVADAGAANDDKWKLEAVNGGDFKISSFASGSYVDVFSVSNTGDVTIGAANIENFAATAAPSSNAFIDFAADAGTDNNDQWKLEAENGGNFKLASLATGNYVDVFSVTNTGDIAANTATAASFSATATSSNNAVINFAADAGTANNDQWRLEAENGGNFKLASLATGSYVDVFSVTNTGDIAVNSAMASSFSATAASSNNAVMNFVADAGAANDDQWKLEAVNGGDFKLASYATGAYVDVLSAANNGIITVSGDLNVNSDRRLKDDIQAIKNAPELLSKLEGKTYNWRKNLGRESGRQYGLIAQEVEAVIPEMVTTNTSDGIKSVNYQAFVPLLIDSVNVLKKQNQQQSEEIALLKQQIALQQQILNRVIEAPQEKNNTTVSR